MANIENLRHAARRRLPRMVFDHLDGAALDEQTMRENRAGFSRLLLKQRVLVDVSKVDIDLEVFGRRINMPVMISPMGLLTLFSPEADVAVASEAAKAGTIFVHSGWSGCRLEEVTSVAPGAVWSQISFWTDPAYMEGQVARARELGVEVLVVAGDVAVSSKRERDIQHGFSMPPRPPWQDLVQTATRPGWLFRYLSGRKISFGNFETDPPKRRLRDWGELIKQQESPATSWEQFRRLREHWDGKLVVKGVMCAEDAERAVAEGADGIIVSNHGGRQFDSQPGTISVLPEVAAAASGRCEVFLDGGIRRGSDVLKALALGATACLVGRPAAYGLAAGGAPGVGLALTILRDELEVALGFVGRLTLGDLDASVFATSPNS